MPQRKRPTVHPAQRFQKQIATFSVLTLLVLGGVLYVAFSRTTITVTPALVERALAAHITVGPENAEKNPDLIGALITKDLTATATLQDFATITEEPDYVTGTVTIVNRSSQHQPLAEGTRLLAHDALFRTQRFVDVPAGGSVTVTVKSDDTGTKAAIPASRFEIVALWPQLKEQIYGETTEAFTGGVHTTAHVAATDIEKAKEQAYALLGKEAQALFAAEKDLDPVVSTYIPIATKSAVTNEHASANAGDTVSELTYSVTATVTAIGTATSLDEPLTAATVRVQTPGMRLVRWKEGTRTVSVESVDATNGTASLLVSDTALSAITESASLLAKENFTGKTKGAIEEILATPEIASADVRFSPFWIFRAPDLADHITIKLTEPR